MLVPMMLNLIAIVSMSQHYIRNMKSHTKVFFFFFLKKYQYIEVYNDLKPRNGERAFILVSSIKLSCKVLI
jgi:hypothetical protein